MLAPRGTLPFLALVLVLLSSACQPATEPPPETKRAQPAGEQVLRVAGSEPATLDPGLVYDTSLPVVRQLFEGLVGVDARGAIYSVQASRWEVSDDGLQYTFHLREGLLWSDGQPLTAHDYVYAWRRNLSPTIDSPNAPSLYPLRNARRIHTHGASPATLGVRAADRRTLVVTLEQPAAYFLQLVSTAGYFPLPRRAVEQHADRWTEPGSLVSSGPFALASWQHGRELVLVPNAYYWGVKPVLQRVVYRLFADDPERGALAAYQADEIDLYPPLQPFPLGLVERLRGDPRLAPELRQFPASGATFVLINHRRPELTDRRVRLALGLAVDRERLVREVLKGTRRPATSLQPEGIAGRKPGLWPATDLKQAQELLADAGYPSGQGLPTFNLAYLPTTHYQAIAEYLQRGWRETLGVNVRLAPSLKVELPNPDEAREPDERTRFDLSLATFVSDFEDPYNWYNHIWDSVMDARLFRGGWQHRHYNQLVRLARVNREPRERLALYEQAEGVLAREYPHLPLFYDAYDVLAKPYVQNLTVSRAGGFLPLAPVALGPR